MGPPRIHIRLLGEFRLRSGEASLPPLESARAGSLLAYLLLHRDASQPRQHLAFLLWPDSTEAQARTNLRHTLHTLRRALPDPDRFLEVTPRTLQWRADAPFWLDVAAFETAVSWAERNASDSGLAALRDAVELYTGDLLEGYYDEWLLGERERLRQRYLEALERLTTLLERRGRHAEAVPYAERLLRHDPLREETYRLLMRLHDARGDRARAVRVYHVCAATLERELGIEPSASTREAYEALLPHEREPAGSPPQADRAGRVGGPPLVGRASEWTHLTSLWRETEKGHAQLVLVSGESGIGKTRLVEEFRSWCAHRGAVTAKARSYAAEGALAYGPLVAWLRSDALRSCLDRLDRVHLAELARLLPDLLSEVPGLPHPEPLPETEQRQRLFDAAAHAVLKAGSPLLLVADDVQWCDRETLQFVHYLLRVEPSARLLVAATARREEIDQRHPLSDLIAGLLSLERLAEIELGRLSQEETAALAGGSLEAPEAELLYRETEGNPLFVIEALRAGWSGSHADRRWMSPKVQAVIESRLARLSEPARDLVGVAATIGREFTADLLIQASGAGEEALVRGLDELWRRRIVREQGADAYDFSHDKIREAACLALSPARRRHYHLQVAHALERTHAHDPAGVSGQIAAHLERAGAAEKAVIWYQRAAEAAQLLYAKSDAVRLLDSALDLIRMLPESPERQSRELSLLTVLPPALGWVEGWGSDRLAAVQRRALDLARAIGVEPEAPLLISLAIASLARRDFGAARGLGERLAARGERDADDVLRVEADYVLGIAAFWQGEFEVARRHFEAAVDRYRPEHRRAHLLEYGFDPKVICLSRLGNTLWFLGRAEEAARARDAALALADEVGHPMSRSTALSFAVLLSLELRDPERLRAYTARLKAEQGEDKTRPTQVSREVFEGYIDVLDGREEVGLARLQRALSGVRQTDHAPGMRAFYARLLLEAYAVTGNARAGLAAADSALASGDADRLWEAEVRRFRAEFLEALGASGDDIEAELGRALQIARRQGALLFELRTAASLLHFRLVHGSGGDVSEARDRLGAIVDRFAEGHDTPDLRDAAALLSQS